MLTREETELREKEFLAPYAICSTDSKGREHNEKPCEFRTAFQRDHDRIVHSEAFRRLEYKTQVFVNHEGDYYRTRLTHTLEVAQMSRGIARTLHLNQDLAESIALCHDLGHTPFGHSGEDVLDELMRDHGGFEHNTQSHRVVTLLEKRYPNFPGLNLTREVLDGTMKHSGTSSLEAQAVDIADKIAYLNHDLDDGLESGMITFEQLEGIELWSNLFDAAKKKFPKESPKIWKYQVVRQLIHLLLNDVKKETSNRIKAHNIATVSDVMKADAKLVCFSSETEPRVKKLKEFLYVNLYKHYRVERMAEKAKRIIEDLFNTYNANPKILPTSIQERVEKDGKKERIICDYIAGMTDRFALDEYNKLFDPHEKV
jgi:dGTPase